MKNISVLIICLFLSGCATVDGKDPFFSGGILSGGNSDNVNERKKELTNMQLVYPGMTCREVSAILGDEVRIGYEQSPAKNGAFAFKPILLKNPYRTEILNMEDGKYEVFYYLTSVQNADGIISEEELTPLVFKKGKLVGKGQDFLFNLKK